MDSGWKMSASFDSKKRRDHLSAVRGLLRGSVPDYASAVRLSMSVLQSLASVSRKGDVTATGGSSDGDGKSNNGRFSIFGASSGASGNNIVAASM
eukprot:6980330-Ditylum_brightwellii.AAC.1